MHPRRTKGEITMAEKIGSGRRSRQLAGELAAKGAKNPAGLAAKLGRDKYGAARHQALAQAGKRRVKAEGAALAAAGARVPAAKPPPAPAAPIVKPPPNNRRVKV